MSEKNNENHKQLIFRAVMVQCFNPTIEEIENARKYINSFKDKL